MDKATVIELKEKLFNEVYAAYLTARQMQGSPNHPIISGLRAYLITHFGQRGRRAVEEANRAIINSQKLEAREALPKSKRLPSPGGKRPARPLGELPPALQVPQVQEENPLHLVEGPAAADDLLQTFAENAKILTDAAGATANQLSNALTRAVDTVLSDNEKAELLTMTPRAAGSHFGADRLRATLTQAGQDVPADMKQTQLAAALIALLKK